MVGLTLSKNIYISSADVYSMKTLIVLLTIALIGCNSPDITQSQGFIQDEIDAANYCETKEDCVDAGGRCPFGCYNYVNKDKVEHIKELLDSYQGQCEYKCTMCLEVKCDQGKCISICG